MKLLFTFLALLTSVLAIVFSVLPISNLAIFPALAALFFSIVAFYLSKKAGRVKKIIPFTIILTAMALSITAYKWAFTKTEVINTKSFEIKEDKLEKEAIKELEGIDIEIDETDLETIEFGD